MGITSGLRGWFAVLYDWETGDPEQTGVGSYQTPHEAAKEAKMWAREEGCECDKSVIDALEHRVN